jgi:hypothetical protein
VLAGKARVGSEPRSFNQRLLLLVNRDPNSGSSLIKNGGMAMKTTFCAAALTLLVLASYATSGSGQQQLGEIDFFGYKGIDLAVVRSALPFREGDFFPPDNGKSSDELKRQVGEKVRQAIGREPTSVTFVCCDSRQRWMVYIGLPGESYQPLSFNPAPNGNIRLPKAALTLYEKMDNAWASAVMKGHATEDDSQGFTLLNDPTARAAELAIHKYALRNETRILQVLASSSDARHRAVAAQMAGYGRQSNEQTGALVQASLDSDNDVRNNAIRALEVLANSKPELAHRVPSEPFVRLIRSGAWSDRNKASFLLVALTKSRDPNLLSSLRRDALDSLVEMARWRASGHAAPALLILGRIASIDEDSLGKLIDAGDVDAVIGKLQQQ